MSNVTLWLPAGEFSFIRSHTKDTPTDFDVGLEGETNKGCLVISRGSHAQLHAANCYTMQFFSILDYCMYQNQPGSG